MIVSGWFSLWATPPAISRTPWNFSLSVCSFWWVIRRETSLATHLMWLTLPLFFIKNAWHLRWWIFEFMSKIDKMASLRPILKISARKIRNRSRSPGARNSDSGLPNSLSLGAPNRSSAAELILIRSPRRSKIMIIWPKFSTCPSMSGIWISVSISDVISLRMPSRLIAIPSSSRITLAVMAHHIGVPSFFLSATGSSLIRPVFITVWIRFPRSFLFR